MGRKPTNDPNLFAKRVFDNLLDKLDPEAVAGRPPEPRPEKNAKAQAAGRKGGKKGGPARASTLSASKRQRIARKAARARWSRPAK